jgi:hypothetical protein
MSWRGGEEPAWPEFAADAAPPLAEDATPPGGDLPSPSASRTGDPLAPVPAPVPEVMMPLFGATRAADPAAAVAADRTAPAPAAGAGRPAHPLVTRRSALPLAAGHASRPDHVRGMPAETAHSGLEPATARPGPAELPPVRREPQHRAGPAASGGTDPAGRGDVEIHIGRIEVTAVSPPPAAPAPKAARKAINLDDYLRNRR